MTDKILAAPWLSDAILEVYTECANDTDTLQALTDACEQVMLAAGDDVSTRFFVLHLYYWLKRFAEPEVPWDEDAEEVHARIADALGHLVSLVSVGDCPGEWPIVRWEITNAYAAGQWGRAADLYDLAEKVNLIPARDVRLMRGQFRYQLAADAPYDPLRDVTWEPRILGSKDGFNPPQPYPADAFSDQLAQATLFVHAVERSTGLLGGLAPGKALDSFRDARNDLEKAIVVPGSNVCRVYEAILARCCFEVGDFANAARYYGALLKGTIYFGEELGDSRKMRRARAMRVCPRSSGLGSRPECLAGQS